MVEPQAHLSVIATDIDSTAPTLIPTPVGESFHAISLPPGMYSFSALQMGSSSVRFWCVPSFRIRPDAACYIGDLQVSIRANAEFTFFRVHDDRESALRRMQEELPAAAAAVPFVVDLVREGTATDGDSGGLSIQLWNGRLTTPRLGDSPCGRQSNDAEPASAAGATA
jgi:hypothetical protein